MQATENWLNEFIGVLGVVIILIVLLIVIGGLVVLMLRLWFGFIEKQSGVLGTILAVATMLLGGFLAYWLETSVPDFIGLVPSGPQ